MKLVVMEVALAVMVAVLMLLVKMLIIGNLLLL